MKLQRVVRVGDGIERCGEAYDDRTHLRMNVAEDVRNALTGKRNSLAGSCLIEPEIKAFAVEEGEDIVEEGIGIGKLNDAANGNDLQMGDEGAVFLQERVMALWRKREGGSARDWIQPCYGRDAAMLVLLG